MNKVQLTQEGFDQLQKELNELKNVIRPVLLERLAAARAMGDLRENSEYSAAKEEQGLIEGRILELEQLIANAEVITTTGKSNRVQIGCDVEVEVNGKIESYSIVGEFEADPMNKKLSPTSPIGKALMGKKIGDTVEVEVPIGKMVFKIVKVR
ncbi:MAG: transcription elongation factor GreA [Patescibacteria group bacterium]|nr:transcription elongation factor GreA [Patescibacteria group bacterium]